MAGPPSPKGKAVLPQAGPEGFHSGDTELLLDKAAQDSAAGKKTAGVRR